MRSTLLFYPRRSRNSSSNRSNATRLLVDGGFIHMVGKGLYAWLPFGMELVKIIRSVISEELHSLGGAEILLPVINPFSLRLDSGRDRIAVDEFMLINDRNNETLIIAPDHEESLVSVLTEMIRDRAQLPAVFYQIQVKGRDKPDGGGGIFTARESLSLDGYSIHPGYSDLNNFVPKLFRTCRSIFEICGLSPLVAEGMPAFPGGQGSLDFVIASRNGDYRVITCEKCGYTADQQVAIGLSKVSFSRLLPLSVILQAKSSVFREIAKQIGIPDSRVAQCQLWNSLNGIVMSVIRGDQKISLIKLARLAGEPILGLVRPEDYAELGLVPEFLSPLENAVQFVQTAGIRILVDRLVAETPNLVLGANATGQYVVNANFGRDFEGDQVGDLALVDERNRCYHCGGALKVLDAIKLATISRLDDHFSRSMGFAVPAEDGSITHPFMGSIVLGLDRLIGAMAYIARDKRGIIWPIRIAPWQAVLLVVGKSSKLMEIARQLHQKLEIRILWDDRLLPFASKVQAADRMGIPIRVVISAKTQSDNHVVLMFRDGPRLERVAIQGVEQRLQEIFVKQSKQAGFLNEI